MSLPITTVVFRRFRTGELVALFPEIPWSLDPNTCTSYQSVGQHGAADCAYVVRSTRPVPFNEALPLVRELRRIGYRLRIVPRVPRGAAAARMEAILASTITVRTVIVEVSGGVVVGARSNVPGLGIEVLDYDDRDAAHAQDGSTPGASEASLRFTAMEARFKRMPFRVPV